MKKEVVTLAETGKILSQDTTHIVIERDVPELTYDHLETQLKHIQGQVLTVIEATVPPERLVATKAIIKGYFNDKLTWMFDLYGHTSEQEIPAYDETGERLN